MRVYGELEPIARFSERSGFLINCDSSAMELMFRTSSLFVGRNWNPLMMKRQGLVVIAGVVFFPSSSLIGVMLFPNSVR